MTTKIIKNRLVAIANLLIVALLGFASCGGTKTNTTGKITMDEIRKTDLSHRLFMPDTILVESDYDFEAKEYILNEKAFEPRWFEPIGFRGSDCQRFYIHYDSVYHKGNGVYGVYGRTRYRDTIRFFSGTLTLNSLRLNNGDYLPKYGGFGRLYGHYQYIEDEFSGGGILSGKMRIDFAKVNGRYYYDAFLLMANGYHNNQYEGVWTSKDLSRKEKCNWGDFRIPDSRGLGSGEAEFIPRDSCLDRGWRIYTYRFEDNDSLNALYQADEQWFTHEDDYFIPYSGKLQRYFTTYGPNQRPAAKILLATIPATEEEYLVWYEMSEASENGQYQYLWPLFSDYAHADSTDILFAYMRMGEFSDGIVSEGIFDDYIKLKKEYPALFAKYRKRLSRMWNEVFDEEEKLYGD